MIKLKPIDIQQFDVEGYGVFDVKYISNLEYQKLAKSIDMDDEFYLAKILVKIITKWDKKEKLDLENIQAWAINNAPVALQIAGECQNPLNFVRFPDDTKKK